MNDNFDYEGGALAADLTNFLTRDVIDPYSIGKRVGLILII